MNGSHLFGSCDWVVGAAPTAGTSAVDILCSMLNFEFAEPYFGIANSIYVLFLDVNVTTNSWKVWKYKVNIEYQTEENRVMTTETGFLEQNI